MYHAMVKSSAGVEMTDGGNATSRKKPDESNGAAVDGKGDGGGTKKRGRSGKGAAGGKKRKAVLLEDDDVDVSDDVDGLKGGKAGNKRIKREEMGDGEVEDVVQGDSEDGI